MIMFWRFNIYLLTYSLCILLLFFIIIFTCFLTNPTMNMNGGYPTLRNEPITFDKWNSMDELNDGLIVIYNRIPKTGSTTFINIAYDLCNNNSFSVLHLNTTKNSHVMSLKDQMMFVTNITHWKSRRPALYHGHVGYINFEKFGYQLPIYINILREPMERLVSYYYFLRYGDNYRPHVVRSKHGNKETFDTCVKLKQADCHPNNMWLQIPFLCGQEAACWEPGNKWALERAKQNLAEKYLLVGVTEDLPSFVSILESVLPSFFQGASHHFEYSHKQHLRKTNKKIEPSTFTIAEVQRSVIWQMENELYQFAYQQFQFVKKYNLLSKKLQFRYEKIYPKVQK